MNPTEKYPPEGFDMIGKTYQAIEEDPFKEGIRCRVMAVKPNHRGEYWVRYVAVISGVREVRLERTAPLKQFKQMWKEV